MTKAKTPSYVIVKECKKAGPIGDRRGTIYLALPAEFIGAKCRVRIEVVEKGGRK